MKELILIGCILALQLEMSGNQSFAQAEDSYFDRFEDTSEFLSVQPEDGEKLESNRVDPPIANLKGTGNWTYLFKFVSNQGQETILSSFQADKLFKPASNEKYFTSLWAFQKKARTHAYLSKMLHESVNSMADSTFKLLGGATAMKKFYAGLGFTVNAKTFTPADGSGLSYSNKVTSEFEMSVLEYIHQSSFYDDYKELLAQPGETGTLEARFPEFKDRLFAKTGTLADTAALGGFLEFKSGTLIFVMISNGLKISVSSARQKIDSVVRSHAKLIETSELVNEVGSGVYVGAIQ